MQILAAWLCVVLAVVGAYDCVVRADCNNHGDCVNGYCHCDPGWSGTTCTASNSSCPLPCEHGSTPDVPSPQCTHCVGCWPGWQGKLCEVWNDTAASLDQMLAHVQQDAQDSLNYQASLYSMPQPPIPGYFGIGIDTFSGQYTQLPIFALDFSNPNLTWTNKAGKTFRLPANAVFEPLDGRSHPTTSTFVFRSIGQYLDYIASLDSNLQGDVCFNDDVSTVYTESFAEGCEVFALTERQYSVYRLTLSGSPQLDKFSARAIDYLPPTYNSSVTQALWNSFVSKFGTGVNSQVDVGGFIYSTQSVIGSALDFNQFDWPTMAAADFNCDLQDASACASLNPFYLSTRAAKSKAQAVGGNPALLSNLTDWVESIELSPAQSLFKYQETSGLIPDPQKRACMQQAVDAYLSAKRVATTSQLKAKARPHLCAAPLTQTQSFASHGIITRCQRPADHVFGCALSVVASGKEEPFPHYVPVTGGTADGCDCYDYFGGTCYTTCGTVANPSLDSAVPLLYSHVAQSEQGPVDVMCPAGTQVLGCGLLASTSGHEPYPAMFPLTSNAGCHCYDDFGGSACHSLCGGPLPGSQVVSAGPGKGLVSVKCPAGLSVTSCGFETVLQGKSESYKSFYPSGEGCVCYDDMSGVTCFAHCVSV